MSNKALKKQAAIVKQNVAAFTDKLNSIEHRNPVWWAKFLDKWQIPASGKVSEAIIQFGAELRKDSPDDYAEYIDDLNYIDSSPAVGADGETFSLGDLTDSVTTQLVQLLATKINTTNTTGAASTSGTGSTGNTALYIIIGLSALSLIVTILGIFTFMKRS